MKYIRTFRKNPYERPSLKEKYEKLKKWKRLSKVRRSGSKPPRKPLSAGGSGKTQSQHWKEKERDITSKYRLPKRIRHWKRKTKKSKYKPKPRTIQSRYIR